MEGGWKSGDKVEKRKMRMCEIEEGRRGGMGEVRRNGRGEL